MLMEFLQLFLGGAKQTDLDIPSFHYTTFQLVDKKSRHSLGTTRDLGIGNLSTVDHTGDFAVRCSHGEGEPRALGNPNRYGRN